MLSDGYYRICHQDPTTGNVYSIDFQGGSDVPGTRVWAYRTNESDAQLTYLKTWDGQNGQEISFPFSQRALRLDYSSHIFDYPYTVFSCDSNYRSADKSSESIMRFEFEATGSTASFDNTTYPTYYIKPAKAGGFIDLRLFVGNAETANYAYFLGFREKRATDVRTAETFFFVPEKSLPIGIYELRPAANMRWAIGASGTASGTTMYVEAFKDTNNQKWLFTSSDIGEYRMLNIAAKKYLTCPQSDEENLIPYLWDALGNNPTQLYSSYHAGTGEYNGDIYDTFMIGPQYGTNLRLDIADTEKTSGVTAGNRFMIHRISGSWLQYWNLRLTEAFDGLLSVPKVQGLAPVSGGKYSVILPRIDHIDKGEWDDYDYSTNGEKRSNYHGYLNFSATTGDSFQVRFRERTRSWSGNWNGWGDWEDWNVGSKSFDGWGAVGMTNVEVSNRSYSKWVAKPYVDSATWYNNHQDSSPVVTVHSISSKELQIQVRALRNDYLGQFPAHSDWQTYTTRLLWEPVTFIKGVKFTPKYGLVFEYTADWDIAGNGLRIVAYRENGQKMCDFTSDLDLPAGNGQVIVPMKNLKWIPDLGEPLTVQAYYTNCDSTWEVPPATVKVGYQGDYSAPIKTWVEPLNKNESYQGHIETPESEIEEVKVWIDVIKGHETHLEECIYESLSEDKKTTTCRICPQYARKSRVWFYVLLKNGKWSINGLKLDELNPYMAGCTFSWVDDDNPYLMLAMDESAPELSRSYDANSEKYVTNGREHEIVKFGRTINSSFSITAKIINDITFNEDGELEAQTVFLADRLAYTRGATVIFRSYIGDWARVVITSVNVDRTSPDVNEVSVSMTEVSL